MSKSEFKAYSTIQRWDSSGRFNENNRFLIDHFNPCYDAAFRLLGGNAKLARAVWDKLSETLKETDRQKKIRLFNTPEVYYVVQESDSDGVDSEYTIRFDNQYQALIYQERTL